MRTQWSLGGYALGGTKQRGGWLVCPYVSLWWRQLLFGVTWNKDEFEDPDPRVAFHLGPVVLWVRFLRILPGFRAARRAHRQRVRGDTGGV